MNLKKIRDEQRSRLAKLKKTLAFLSLDEPGMWSEELKKEIEESIPRFKAEIARLEKQLKKVEPRKMYNPFEFDRHPQLSHL